jgi:hypothetical protein
MMRYKRLASLMLAGVLGLCCTGCSQSSLDADGDGTVTLDELIDFVTSCLVGEEEPEPSTPPT